MPLPPELDIEGVFAAASEAAWRRLVEQDLAGAPFEKKLITHTYEGIDLKPLYTASDLPAHAHRALADGDGLEASGFPPFTRGGALLGRSASGWDIRQEHSAATPEALNAQMLEDLEGGVTSVLVRLDAAMRLGLDPADAAATGRLGVDGCTLSTPADWDRAFAGVHLEMIGVTLEAGAAFVPAAAQLAALWRRRGVPVDRARGAFNADPLAVLAREGALPMGLDRAMQDAADLAAWTSAHLPGVTAIRVGTAAYHHAGCTATQDLAYSIATGLEYLRAMASAGLPIDRAAGQVLFSLAVGTHGFLAIAKLRAARRLWWRVVEHLGGSARAGAMRMHVRPSKRVMSTRDPWVNILRNTSAVMAAALAGAEAIGSEPFDLALGPPSARGRRLARNTQIILMEECHLHRIADPAGGSYFVERLTEDLAGAAWALLQRIEARGGMARCILEGEIARQIEASMSQRTRDLSTRKEAITGVSEFPLAGERLERPPPIDPAELTVAARSRPAATPGPRAREALREIGATRVAGARTARAVDAASDGAGIGAIFAALVAGDPGPVASTPAPITLHPFAEPFERLRDAADRYAASCGHPPRAFIASVGPLAEHLARTTWVRNMLLAGGFEVRGGTAFASPEEATREHVASGAGVAVIAAADAAYPALVPTLAPMLHAAGARRVVLAGHPGASEAAWRSAGVDDFAYVRCDVVRLLDELLRAEGAQP